jgi:hypothetical protein
LSTAQAEPETPAMKSSLGPSEIKAEPVIAFGSYCVPYLTAYDPNLTGNGNVPKIEQCRQETLLEDIAIVIVWDVGIG